MSGRDAPARRGLTRLLITLSAIVRAQDPGQSHRPHRTRTPSANGPLPARARSRAAASPGLPRPASRRSTPAVAARRSAADRARAGRSLRLQPDHVRRALSELVREGRIERTRGRGTTVLPPRIERDFAEQADVHGRDAAPRPGSRDAARSRPGPSPPARPWPRPSASSRLADALPRAAAPGRRRAAAARAGPPAGRAVPGAARHDLEHDSLYELLDERYGTRVARAREALEPVLLRAREARLLEPARGGRRPCSSRASPRPPTTGRSSSAGPTSAATERATTWSGGRRSPGPGGSPSRSDRQEERAVHRRSPDRRDVAGGATHARTTGRFAACSRSCAIVAAPAGTTSSAPRASSVGRRIGATAAAEVGAAASAARRPSPVITPLPDNTSQAKPGDVVIRWYCCLGTGDAPEQVAVEQKVADAFNAANPGIHLQFEGFVVRRALATRCRSSSRPATAPTSSVRSASAARTPSTTSGSTCSRSSTRPAST